MPIPSSPFNSVPNGIARPAQPMPPQAAAALLSGGGPQVAPPGAQVSPPSVENPNDPMAAAPGSPQAEGQDEMDLFQRVVSLLMDPRTRQVNMPALLIFAGLGAAQ